MNAIGPKYTYTFDGTRFDVYHPNAGEGIPRHAHEYGHATMCHAGSIRVSTENKSKTLTKVDGAVMLPPGEWHEIEALEDNTVFVNVMVTR